MGEKVLTAISPGQLMAKIVPDDLTRLMGREESDIVLFLIPSFSVYVG